MVGGLARWAREGRPLSPEARAKLAQNLVKARAARTAPDVASDPFLPKRTISAQGINRVSRSAN